MEKLLDERALENVTGGRDAQLEMWGEFYEDFFHDNCIRCALWPAGKCPYYKDSMLEDIYTQYSGGDSRCVRLVPKT